VISVSKSMRIIALFIDGTRFVLEESAAVLSHANQALATLERYRRRLDEVSGALSALEIEDLATVRDVTALAQRLEMVRRISGEIEGYMVELGTDRLDGLPLDELLDVASVAEVLGFGGSEALDDVVSPHGYRLLAKVPRIPSTTVDSLIEHFGGLQKLLAAGVEDLNQVDGVGASHARGVREGLSRLAESSILERYV
jgi:diadenylate cyclase